MKKMMFLVLTLCLGISASIHAQVTIGRDKEPHISAVLDLQSDKLLGLKLPSVALHADPTDFVLEGETDKATATGMVIYNTANVGQDPGIYAWDGAKWFPIGSNPGDSNNSGFNALPAGYVDPDGTTAFRFSYRTYLWTSSESGSDGVYRYLDYNSATINSNPYDRAIAFSVRCLRN